VDGKVVVDARALVAADISSVLTGADRSAKSLVARID